MKITRKGVSRLIEEELKMANQEFPLFRSDHEGLGVIEEEMFEVTEEYRALRDTLYDMKRAIFRDEDQEKKQICASHITLIATELACEAIQVAAMGYKFNASNMERRENEND